MTDRIDLPEQPEQLMFDFHGQCKAYRLPDGMILVIDRNLKTWIVNETDFYMYGDDLSTLVELLRNWSAQNEVAHNAQLVTVAG